MNITKLLDELPPSQLHIPLLFLWERQTEMERAGDHTIEDNGIGYNSADALFAGSLIKWHRRGNPFSPRQAEALRKMLRKYKGQLAEIGDDLAERVMVQEPEKPQPTMTRRRVTRMVSFMGDRTGNKYLKITFPYDPSLVSQVRTLEGRRFNGDEKFWTCPTSLASYEKLREWGFPFEDAVVAYFDSMTATAPADQQGTISVPGLDATLYDFQKQGVAFLEAKNGRAIIADEMGLGKTIQALSFLALHPEKKPAIVVCPAHLKLNWVKEAIKWLDNPRIQLLSGREPAKGMKISGDILIINYDILWGWTDALKKIKPQVLITDECHYYKSNKARRTKAIKKLAKVVPHIIPLSGTPLVNRPIEMFNAISLVAPGLFSNFWEYARKFCGAKHNGFGWDFTGSSNTQELHDILTGTVMIRRLKKDVLKDLPPKVRTVLPVEITNRTEYDYAEANFLSWLKEVKGVGAASSAATAETLARIEHLKQLSIAGKMSSVLKWIRDFLDTDEKLVVFATHHKTIDTIMEAFKGVAVKCDGRDSQDKRERAVEGFQNKKEVRLFVGNIKAAGTGITLTEASNTCFVELGWSPGEHDQAEDRVHRIGQTDSVTAWYLLASQTIEEEIIALIDKKRKVLDQVLDGRETEEVHLLTELLNRMTEEKK